MREKEVFERKKLEAIAQASGGKMGDRYSSSWGTEKYVEFENGSIAQHYDGKYKVRFQASFGETLKIVSFLMEMNQSRE